MKKGGSKMLFESVQLDNNINIRNNEGITLIGAWLNLS